MKKYSILFLTAALVFAASCKRAEIEEPVAPATDSEETVVPRGLTFKATWETPEDPAGTKTALGENGLDVLWMKNDALSVFDGEGDAYAPSSGTFAEGYVKDTRYQAYEVSEDSKTASFAVSNGFEPVAEGKSIYWAFTPRIGDAAVNIADGKLIAWLTRYQRGNSGNFSEHRGTVGRYLNFAVGSTTDPENEPIVFKNILCHLKFVIPADMDGIITRIGVHTGNGEYLSGDQYVDLTGEKPSTSLRYNVGDYKNGSRYGDMYLFPDHGTGNNANITEGQAFAAGTYYMAIMPCELKAGLFVTFDTVDGEVCHIDHYAASTTFVRNKVYNMGELTWNKPVAAAGAGVTLPYAFCFTQMTNSNGDMVYSNKGSLSVGTATGGYTPASGVIATDKDNTNVSLSALVTKASPKNNSQQNLAYWANVLAHDAINVGAILNRFAVSQIPIENYVRFNIPLAADMPQVFNVSFGMGLSNATYSIADWKVLYSNDAHTWIEFPETIHFTAVNYPYHTFTIRHGELFKAGKMLYVKVVGNSNKNTAGNAADGQGGSGAVRVHSAFVIYNPAVDVSTTPSGAKFYEGFDEADGGIDYFLSGGDRKRLGGVSSLCGEAFSKNEWSATHVFARPGYVQLGNLDTQSSNTAVKNPQSGTLVTPALNVSGDVTLSFNAAAYRHPAAGRTGATQQDVGIPDETSITVTVLDGGTIDGATTIQIDNVDTEAWQTITKTIVGATASTKIQFSSPSTGTYHRWFLDDICIK
jgi:hypothetical protein